MRVIEKLQRIFFNIHGQLLEHVVGDHPVLIQRILLAVSLQTDTLAHLLHDIDVLGPVLIDGLQHADALDLPHPLRRRKLFFLLLIHPDGIVQDLLLKIFHADPVLLLCRDRDRLGEREDPADLFVQMRQIPVARITGFFGIFFYIVVNDVPDHLHDRRSEILALQHLLPLIIDDLALVVHDLVIIQQPFTDAKVILLNSSLRSLDRAGKRLIRDRLTLGQTKRLKHALHPVAAEDPHQIVFHRDIENRFAGVSLTSASASQLVIDTACLMSLRADDLEPAERGNAFAQLDIGTTASHVGRDRDRSALTGLRDNIRLTLMELGVQDGMWDAAALQHRADMLGILYRDRADQYRLTLCVRLDDILDRRVVFLLLGLEDHIRMVDSGDFTVGRDLDDVHTVDVLELALFRLGGTGHAGLFLIFVEEVLERDRRECTALAFDLNVLLSLDGLMQAVGITASGHQTAGELVYDDNLIVLDHIVLIARHQVMRLQRGIDMMQDLRVLRIAEVLELEVLLSFDDTLRSKVTALLLLIDDEIAFLLDLLLHELRKLGSVPDDAALLQAGREEIGLLIQARGLAAPSGNDQRRTRFINQDGVDLVNDRVMQSALNHSLLINDHVVAEIVESELVIGPIRNIAIVGLFAGCIVHVIQNAADGQAQETVDLSHPLSVTVCQVIVDRDDVDALALQSVQIRRQQSDLRLAFTGLHLGDTPLMQDYTADQLHVEMLGMQDPVRGLPHDRVSFRQKVVERLSAGKPLPELIGLGAKLRVGKLLHCFIITLYLRNDRRQPLDLAVSRAAEYLLKKTHYCTSDSFYTP